MPQFQPYPSTPPTDAARTEYDAVVIGSGFGGAFAALELVEAGWRVLMVERGGWVERGPHNWREEGAVSLSPHYADDSAYRVRQGGSWGRQNLCTCVGGASVFFGGAGFRLRERDFDPAPEIVDGTGAAWPFGYGALEPFYSRAERLLWIAGDAGGDPTEPPRSAPYPQAPARLSEASRRIRDAAEALGLHPFRIPLALNYAAELGPVCQACPTCDAFACAIGAKNDVATRIVPDLVARGMTLVTGTVAARLVTEGGRVAAVECVGRGTGERFAFRGRAIVLAAGALATPHLLLASGLDQLSPGGSVVGRYLMRHCNAMTFGVWARRLPPGEHHKQIAINDFYFGASEPGAPAGKLGNLQQIMGFSPGLLMLNGTPRTLRKAVAPLAGALSPAKRLTTGLLAIAEDQPRFENRVGVHPSARDAFGRPEMVVEHEYTARDLAARAFLVRQAKRILRRAGLIPVYTWDVNTFSHAVGTVRMGDDERTSALDPECRFRGLENLWVTDGSVFPTSGGVNPSLTIAANALRVGRAIARGAGVGAAASADAGAAS